jgi:hypothetical protein
MVSIAAKKSYTTTTIRPIGTVSAWHGAYIL